jgi:hypothetical protein
LREDRGAIKSRGGCAFKKTRDWLTAFPFQAALEIFTAAYGDIHEEVAQVHYNLGLMYHAMGTARAKSQCRAAIGQCLRIYRITKGGEHKEVKLIEEWLAGSMDAKWGRPIKIWSLV